MLVNTQKYFIPCFFFFNAVLFITPLHNSKIKTESLWVLAQKCHQNKEAHRSMAYLKHLKITGEKTSYFFLCQRRWWHRKSCSWSLGGFPPGISTDDAGIICPLTMIASVRSARVASWGQCRRGTCHGPAEALGLKSELIILQIKPTCLGMSCACGCLWNTGRMPRYLWE